jgi:hypothetical protein
LIWDWLVCFMYLYVQWNKFIYYELKQITCLFFYENDFSVQQEEEKYI